MSLSETQKAVELLRIKPSTAEDIALYVYGSTGSYALNSVYAMIYRLRKKGINIQKGNDGINLQQVVYSIKEEPCVASMHTIVRCTECNETIVFFYDDLKIIVTTETFINFMLEHIEEALLLRGDNFDKSTLFEVKTEPSGSMARSGY